MDFPLNNYNGWYVIKPNETLLFINMDGFGIKSPAKFEMPFN